MRFIVKDKIYDTNKSEFLGEGDRKYKYHSALLNVEMTMTRNTKLYKTTKGAYFLIHEDVNYQIVIEVISEYEAKKLLMYWNYEKYVELFGELEEA